MDRKKYYDELSFFLLSLISILQFSALAVPGPGGEKLVGGVTSEGGFGFHHFPGHGGHAFYPV